MIVTKVIVTSIFAASILLACIYYALKSINSLNAKMDNVNGILKLIFKRRAYMVFLMRMRSIEKQIEQAVECVSFDILRYASWRIEHENEFPHSKKEQEILIQLVRQTGIARELIKQQLIKESNFL